MMNISRIRAAAILLARFPKEAVVLSSLLVALLVRALPLEAAPNFPGTSDALRLAISAMQNIDTPVGTLPTPDLRGAPVVRTITATAYNSVPGQTDDTPFITAAGTPTRHGIIAANFLPIGTKVKIPDVYGDQIFTVEDRMNPRYHERIDIWMEEVGDAKKFGVRNVRLEIYPNPARRRATPAY